MVRPAVLVTGAAKRLGAAMARRFAESGWQVAIHYRSSRDEAEALADELPDAITVQADLSDPQAIRMMVAELAERLPDWRVLVNSASRFELDTADAIDPALFDRAMRTDAAGPVMLAQQFLALGGETPRRVINVLDQKIANPNPDFFSYSMAKAVLAMATRMLAMAHGDKARIYGLSPGAMLPSFDQIDQEHQRSGRMNLLNRLTAPDELADAAVFLAEGHLASGETIHVDSGQHLLAQPRDVLFMARQEAID